MYAGAKISFWAIKFMGSILSISVLVFDEKLVGFFDNTLGVFMCLKFKPTNLFIKSLFPIVLYPKRKAFYKDGCENLPLSKRAREINNFQRTFEYLSYIKYPEKIPTSKVT